MERTLYYTIGSENHGQTIQSFLKQQGFSTQNIISLKKMPESILLNNVWAYVNQTVQTGDVITIHINETESSEKILPIKLPLEIIYEDEDLMVINKPANMPVHPSMDNYDNSLANALAYYFEQQSIPFTFRCINRLDKDTSGLVLVAKHMLSANLLSTMIAAKRNAFQEESSSVLPPTIQREYLAIVEGTLNEPCGVINAPIARKEGSIIEREVNFTHGEEAITHYKLIDTFSPATSMSGTCQNYSLLSLRLETGRTHQIRVHMKYLGHPLAGDLLYNPSSTLLPRQALHSSKLSFIHPITKEGMEFHSSLPQDMHSIFPAF